MAEEMQVSQPQMSSSMGEQQTAPLKNTIIGEDSIEKMSEPQDSSIEAATFVVLTTDDLENTMWEAQISDINKIKDDSVITPTCLLALENEEFHQKDSSDNSNDLLKVTQEIQKNEEQILAHTEKNEESNLGESSILLLGSGDFQKSTQQEDCGFEQDSNSKILKNTDEKSEQIIEPESFALKNSLQGTCNNVDELEDKNKSLLDVKISKDPNLVRLSNTALTYSKFAGLKMLVLKEDSVKKVIENEVGKGSVKKLSKIVKTFQDKAFIDENIVENVILYHKVRNIAIQSVEKKLNAVYCNPMMVPILNLDTDDVEYRTAIENLEVFVKGSWVQKVIKAEELNFDLEFLNILLTFWQNKKTSTDKNAEENVQLSKAKIKTENKTDKSSKVKSKTKSNAGPKTVPQVKIETEIKHDKKVSINKSESGLGLECEFQTDVQEEIKVEREQSHDDSSVAENSTARGTNNNKVELTREQKRLLLKKRLEEDSNLRQKASQILASKQFQKDLDSMKGYASKVKTKFEIKEDKSSQNKSKNNVDTEIENKSLIPKFNARKIELLKKVPEKSSNEENNPDDPGTNDDDLDNLYDEKLMENESDNIVFCEEGSFPNSEPPMNADVSDDPLCDSSEKTKDITEPPKSKITVTKKRNSIKLASNLINSSATNIGIFNRTQVIRRNPTIPESQKVPKRLHQLIEGFAGKVSKSARQQMGVRWRSKHVKEKGLEVTQQYKQPFQESQKTIFIELNEDEIKPVIEMIPEDVKDQENMEPPPHCTICGEVFSSNNILNKHLIISHYKNLLQSKLREQQVRSNVGAVTCPDRDCRKLFKDEEYLLIHFSTQHTDILGKINFNPEEQSGNIKSAEVSSSYINPLKPKFTFAFSNVTPKETVSPQIPITKETLSQKMVTLPSQNVSVSPNNVTISPNIVTPQNVIVSPQNVTVSPQNVIVSPQNVTTSPQNPTSSIPKSVNDEKPLTCDPCKFATNLQINFDSHRKGLGHKLKVIQKHTKLQVDQSSLSQTERICLLCSKKYHEQVVFSHLETEHSLQHLTNTIQSISSVNVKGVESTDQKERESINQKVNEASNQNEAESANPKETELINQQETESINKTVTESAIQKETESTNEEKNESIIQNEIDSTNPYWFVEFKKFCEERKELVGVEDCLKTNFSMCNTSVLTCFLNNILANPENISKLDDILKDIGVTRFKDDETNTVLDGQNLKYLQIVKQFSLIKDYEKHCKNFGSSLRDCDPMFIIIFLSQLMGRPDVSKDDMKWTLLAINDFHSGINGEPLKYEQKIVDFFKAINIQLLDSVQSKACEEEDDKPSAKAFDENDDKTKEGSSKSIQEKDDKPKESSSKTVEEKDDNNLEDSSKPFEEKDESLVERKSTRLTVKRPSHRAEVDDNLGNGTNKNKMSQVHLDILIPYFEKFPQPTIEQKLELVEKTGLAKQVVQRWFDNRRRSHRNNIQSPVSLIDEDDSLTINIPSNLSAEDQKILNESIKRDKLANLFPEVKLEKITIPIESKNETLIEENLEDKINNEKKEDVSVIKKKVSDENMKTHKKINLIPKVMLEKIKLSKEHNNLAPTTTPNAEKSKRDTSKVNSKLEGNSLDKKRKNDIEDTIDINPKNYKKTKLSNMTKSKKRPNQIEKDETDSLQRKHKKVRLNENPTHTKSSNEEAPDNSNKSLILVPLKSEHLETEEEANKDDEYITNKVFFIGDRYIDIISE